MKILIKIGIWVVICLMLWGLWIALIQGLHTNPIDAIVSLLIGGISTFITIGITYNDPRND